MIARRRLAKVLGALAVVLTAGAGCQSAKPRGPQPGAVPPRPDALAGLVGRTLVLRHVGNTAKVALKRSALASAAGECDVVVKVREARFDKGTAVLTLGMLGRPRLARRGAREERCGDDQAQTILTVSGFDPATPNADLEAGLGPILQTPEAYMRARGVTFDIPAGKVPGEPAPDHLITVKPLRLFWVDAVRPDPGRRVRHEGEVEIEGVVGIDGRLYDGRVLSGLGGSGDEQRVLELLPLWRFEPGRRDKSLVPVKVKERTVFRIYY
jgi:hypothetical protein